MVDYAKQQDVKQRKNTQKPILKQQSTHGIVQKKPLLDEERKTGVPSVVRSNAETMSGTNLDHVKVHYNSPKPEVMVAHAFGRGSDIHFNSGMEQHLGHEKDHISKQKDGRAEEEIK